MEGKLSRPPLDLRKMKVRELLQMRADLRDILHKSGIHPSVVETEKGNRKEHLLKQIWDALSWLALDQK